MRNIFSIAFAFLCCESMNKGNRAKKKKTHFLYSTIILYIIKPLHTVLNKNNKLSTQYKTHYTMSEKGLRLHILFIYSLTLTQHEIMDFCCCYLTCSIDVVCRLQLT